MHSAAPSKRLSLVGVQEFNLEKLNLLETEKQRIRKEYERKEAQVEAQKKMCVAITKSAF
jgi:uncharacterized small protein (DUF1192 family)